MPHEQRLRLTLEQADRKRTAALERIQKGLDAINSLDYSLGRPDFYRLVEEVERASVELSSWQRIYNELEQHGAARTGLDYVVAIGNPFDGIALIGPFEDTEEANEWGDNSSNSLDWWVMHVQSPEAWLGPDGDND